MEGLPAPINTTEQRPVHLWTLADQSTLLHPINGISSTALFQDVIRDPGSFSIYHVRNRIPESVVKGLWIWPKSKRKFSQKKRWSHSMVNTREALTLKQLSFSADVTKVVYFPIKSWWIKSMFILPLTFSQLNILFNLKMLPVSKWDANAISYWLSNYSQGVNYALKDSRFLKEKRFNMQREQVLVLF